MAEKALADCTAGTVEMVELDADEQAQLEADQAAAEQAHWDELRVQRNALLAESDWTQVQDATANPDDWTAYRQELRDLPQTTDDPAAADWPEAPPTPGEDPAG